MKLTCKFCNESFDYYDSAIATSDSQTQEEFEKWRKKHLACGPDVTGEKKE